MDIFKRNIGAITVEQQNLLQRKKVSVIGCGGLGGYVIEQLVRLGVGTITCFDPDVFTDSNYNRQLNAVHANSGRNKAEAAAARSAEIHRYSRVIPFPVDYRSAGRSAVFDTDTVIDCLDNIPARLELASLCTQYQTMLVHGAVSGWLGQVGVQEPGGDLYKKLYPRPAADTIKTSPPVLACTVLFVAGMQVSETLKILLNLPSTLTNGCLFADLQEQEFIHIVQPSTNLRS